MDDTVCTSSRVSLDGEPYSAVNCEMVMGPDIFFLTLYLSEEDELVGGVSAKRQYQEYLELETPGFLLDRWSFAAGK